jgi:hypothetical protein
MGGFAALLTIPGLALTLAACGTGPHQASVASAPRVQGQPRPRAKNPRATAGASRPASRARPHRSPADGGGKVTLNGGGVRRILYLDTCDPRQHWTTSHCQDQPEPRLTVQNLAFEDGNSTGQTYDGEGGGAIFFVSDDNTGTLNIEDSILHDNPSQGFATPGYPGIFFHSSGHPAVTGSTLS